MSVSELSELRAANVDRERVVERLNRAHAEGRLDLLELDERLAVAYAARTYGDLEPLTADLPPVGGYRGGLSADGVAGAGVEAAGEGDVSSTRSAGSPRSPGARWSSGCGPGARRARGYALALRIEGASWVFASLVNLAIWAMVSLGSAESVYPWWIWVAGPWGIVLLARMVEQSVRARSRGLFSTRF